LHSRCGEGGTTFGDLPRHVDLANWLVDLTADMFVARERTAQGDAVLSLEDDGTSVGATVPLLYLKQPFSTSTTD
jgi:hypothetical protein